MKRFLLLTLALLFTLSACAERGTPEFIPEDTPHENGTACEVVIRCAGDFVIHKNVYNAAKKLGGGKSYDFFPMLENVAGYMAQADFTVTNVDGVMGTDDFVKKYGYGGYPSFSTPASLIDAIKDCGADMLTLANNHALDYWYDGLKSTVTSVEQRHILSIGGYRTKEEKLTPRVVDIGGIRFGFLNYTDGLNQMDKRSALDKAALEYGVDFLERANVPADIRRLKEAGAEIIVCFMHWGIEYRTEPCGSQKTNAQMLADAGVDVIIGGHPHMVQRAEYLYTKGDDGKPKEVLCLYSLGNFLTDQRAEGKDCGIIFDFTVRKDEKGNITVHDPVYRTTWVWRHYNGGTFDYRIFFTDDNPERPAGMSTTDYQRMIQSKSDIDALMHEGCAISALLTEEEAAMLDTPER